MILVSVMVCLLFSLNSYAGKLDDFEAEVSKEEETKSIDGDEDETKHSKDKGHEINKSEGHWNNDEDYGFIEMIVHGVVGGIARGVFYGIVGGGRLSLERVQALDELSNEPGESGRELGEALIPYIRLDTAYQVVEPDVSAYDFRLEGGYGPVALQTRFTRYEEEMPTDQLDMIQAHILYRGSIRDVAEVDMGVGGLTLNGAESNSGFSFTMPFLLHPWKFLGFEFRPAWAFVNNHVIQDYDLAALAGWSFIGCRVGYRWVRVGSASLDGPYAGLAVRF